MVHEGCITGCFGLGAISILFIALVWARDVDCMLERASHNLAISSR